MNDIPIPKRNPREHVRLRPGMYFGGTDSRALHHLVWELLDNSIEQVRHGPCNRIEVSLDTENTLSVSDNGAGIPIENYQDTGRSILEIIMTEVGGKSL